MQVLEQQGMEQFPRPIPDQELLFNEKAADDDGVGLSGPWSLASVVKRWASNTSRSLMAA
jgi:hypothetical protein